MQNQTQQNELQLCSHSNSGNRKTAHSKRLLGKRLKTQWGWGGYSQRELTFPYNDNVHLSPHLGQRDHSPSLPSSSTHRPPHSRDGQIKRVIQSKAVCPVSLSPAARP